MNRFLKAAAALVSLICVTAGTLVFAAACHDDPPEDTNTYYTVTISYPDTDGGKGVSGVGVTLSPLNGTAYDNYAKDLNSVTNGDGKAVFDITDWNDTTSYSVEINVENIPAGYSVNSKHTVAIANGYNLDLVLNTFNYQSVSVSLNSKTETMEFEPAARFEDGFYEFRCSDSNVLFTLSDGNTEHPGTFNISQGCSTALVKYTKGVIYDIGTANDITSFDVVFAPVSSTGEQNNPHAIDMGKTIVLDLGANESAYLSNPQEIDIPGVTGGGSPCVVSGENFSAEVDGKTYSQQFKIAGGKILKVSTANKAAGTVVLNFAAIKSSDRLTVGESKQVEISLMNRYIQTSSKTDEPHLIWEVNAFRLNFTVNTAGRYKITVTSNVANAKVNINSLTGIGANLVSIQPDKVAGDTEANSPFTATYDITAANLNVAQNYVFDLVNGVTDFKTMNLKEGDKIIYTILVEKL